MGLREYTGMHLELVRKQNWWQKGQNNILSRMGNPSEGSSMKVV
jgi:hypothetical protein